MPHLQTAVRLRGKVLHLEAGARAFAEALEYIPGGVFLAGNGSRLLEMNTAAWVLLDRRDGLHLTNGELRTSTSDGSQRLRALVNDAIRTTGQEGRQSGGILTIPRSTGRTLQVLVTPLLASRSGLTAAESRLAVVLMNGTELSTAVEQLGITRHTARTHLKRILSKTETNRQGN